MIGNNDGFLCVIANLVSCSFGVKFQNREKVGLNSRSIIS